MEEFIAVYYQLSEDELYTENRREGILSANPDSQSYHLFQIFNRINLDERNPTFSESLTKEELNLDSKIIKENIEKKIFAIDILSSTRKLIARYLLLPDKKPCMTSSSQINYYISKHINIRMKCPQYINNPGEKVKFYELENFEFILRE
jgi:hypothetical protein